MATITHLTGAWHPFGEGRICAHWAEFDAPVRGDGTPQPLTLMQPDGTGRAFVAPLDAEGRAVPTRVRSYIGLILEVDGIQVQVRGRINVGAERLEIQLDQVP